VIPGGGIEESENPQEAAEREVFEEAGVRGRLGRLLGVFEVYEVTFFSSKSKKIKAKD
jgi:8-oxo-dGTP pyrophosphatase MutT (NUDIX family)